MTYANFLQYPERPLANRAYKAIPEDIRRAKTTADANSVAAANVDKTDTSWKTIASRLEVEGMFNVNSTSVIAWRALLGHARNQQIPYMASTGRPTLAAATDHVDVSDDAALADISNSSGSLPGRKVVNTTFGRRFEIVSFRWLTENEI